MTMATNPILHDLSVHLEARIKKAAGDCFARCNDVGIPEEEAIPAIMSAVTLLFCEMVAMVSDMPPEECATIVMQTIRKLRAAERMKG